MPYGFVLAYVLGGPNGLRGSLLVAACAVLVTWFVLLPGRLVMRRRRR
ncbi:MAG TPA: hypothetical protein VGO81_03380 [Solirubrobacteraceae bacterium]|nr:hypothetical protein [Solirubrobacteraceae bacterium]